MSNRIRLTRIASITSELDRIADEVQKYNPEIALAIDKVSDQMENRLAEQKNAFDPEKLKNGTYTGDLMITKDMVEGGKLKLPRIKEVTGYFYCNKLNLTSLDGAPSTVGKDFNCFKNNLTSLEGAPSTVGEDFICSDNNLTSLDKAPTSVGGDFNCNFNKLTSLKGAPSTVNGDFACVKNELKSLDKAPSTVGKSFFCGNNPGKFTEADVRAVCDVKEKIYT